MRVVSDPALGILCQVGKDEVYTQIIKMFRKKEMMPHISPLHPSRMFNSIWDEYYSIRNGNGSNFLLTCGNRTIIPTSAR